MTFALLVVPEAVGTVWYTLLSACLVRYYGHMKHPIVGLFGVVLGPAVDLAQRVLYSSSTRTYVRKAVRVQVVKLVVLFSHNVQLVTDQEKAEPRVGKREMAFFCAGGSHGVRKQKAGL